MDLCTLGMMLIDYIIVTDILPYDLLLNAPVTRRMVDLALSASHFRFRAILALWHRHYTPS